MSYTIIPGIHEMSTKKSINYVNNAEFLDQLKAYQKRSKAAKRNKELPPIVPDLLAVSIMNIARHLAYRPNFMNYSFKDEMIADGIENGLNAIQSFDYKKSVNPFGYFTRVIWWAFVRRIQSEKKYLYTKYKLTRNAQLQHELSGHQAGDGTQVELGVYGTNAQSHMDTFMHDYETTIENKKKKKNEKKIDVDKSANV